ncbi:hypothetical protein JXA88_17430 [Candidatus Fermentibacteria bacterium]|nr:hypothetical protein [Candidatus Fermentibacteria bacterium]
MAPALFPTIVTLPAGRCGNSLPRRVDESDTHAYGSVGHIGTTLSWRVPANRKLPDPAMVATPDDGCIFPGDLMEGLRCASRARLPTSGYTAAW